MQPLAQLEDVVALNYARFLFVSLLLSLSACGGGGSSPGTFPISTKSSAILHDAETTQAVQPLSTPVPASNDLLYVGNQGNNSITVYHHDQQGNTGPLYMIAGSKTEISDPGQLSEDAQGNLYVANLSKTAGSVLVFAHGANGNVAPIRTLVGPATDLLGVFGMTVDKSTGKIFVISQIPKPLEFNPDDRLLRFPPNASGNTAPFAFEVLPFDAEPPPQLASDSTGLNLLMASGGEIGSMAEGAGVYTIQKQFPGYAPNEPIAGFVFATGIADDPTTKSYLFTGSYQSCAGSNNVVNNAGIVRLSESTNGEAEVLGDLPCKFTLSPQPVSVITSETCGGQLALGYLRNIYVVHAKTSGCASDAIYVYTHDSSGSIPPLRVLSGSATKLNQPFGIYEGT